MAQVETRIAATIALILCRLNDGQEGQRRRFGHGLSGRTPALWLASSVPAEIDDTELSGDCFAPAGFNRPAARLTRAWWQAHLI